MLPPDFAAFGFSVDAAGADDGLAGRAQVEAGGGRIAVVGAARWGLLLALARRGAHVVAFDPSRLALRTARDALENAGLADRVTLFAADPRDVLVPGGVDAALVPAFPWRALLTRDAQAETAACLRRAVAPGGALCLDVDRLPPSTPDATEWCELRRGPGGQIWSWRRDPTRGIVTVACEAPRVDRIEVALSDVTPEASVEILRAAGYTDVAASDPAPRAARDAAGRRAWIVARAPVP